MAQIAKHWAGRIYGTNTGNFFLKFEAAGPELKGRLRFLDSEYGVAVYEVAGTAGENIVLSGNPLTVEGGPTLGTLEVNARLSSDGTLRGEWTTSLGTGGTFVGHPHASEDEAQQTESKAAVPEQIFTHSVKIGAVSVFGPDILALISDLRTDFNVGRPLATYSTGAGEVTKWADEFVKDMPTLGALTYLRLQIQEHEGHGINKLAVVELRKYGTTPNEVRTQSTNESWAIGRAEALSVRLKRHQNGFVTIYKKVGLTFNQAIFLGMLVLIPQFASLGDRALFVGSVFAMLHALLWIHSRLVPNADIQASSPLPGNLARLWPNIVSFLLAVIASVIAAYLYAWLTPPAP